MTDAGDRLQTVLDGYATFLRERDLAPSKQQPYLIRWVREFLHFARAHDGYTFEQTLDLFLAEVGGRDEGREDCAECGCARHVPGSHGRHEARRGPVSGRQRPSEAVSLPASTGGLARFTSNVGSGCISLSGGSRSPP